MITTIFDIIFEVFGTIANQKKDIVYILIFLNLHGIKIKCARGLSINFEKTKLSFCNKKMPKALNELPVK